MKNFVRIAAAAACLGLLAASAAHADEIYKWVDKDGKTHYSSRPEDAAGAQTKQVQAPPGPAGGSPTPYTPSSNEEIIHRGMQGTSSIDGRYVPPAPKPVVRNYASKAPAARCQLARDILSGDARHTNGASTDARDRLDAEKDVRTYCK
jgi:hypothetical protein